MIEQDRSGAAMPIGPRVDASAARRPERTTIRGRLVTLVPLDPLAHGDALYAATRGEGADQLWVYLFEGPFSDRADFDLHLRRMAASEDPLFLAILDAASGDAVGYAAYMRIEPAHRVIEVGSILYTPRLQQTALATEAIVPDGPARLRGSRLPPLRVEMQRSERTFASSGVAVWFYVRGDFP